MKEGKIVDDTRITAALPTIKYCIDQNAKVVLFSHLGRVKEEADLAKNNLAPVAKRLEELLGKKVTFIEKHVERNWKQQLITCKNNTRSSVTKY